MPFADKLPKPEDVVASAYDFAEQLLASQRKFAEEVLKATASLMPGTEDSTSSPRAPPHAGGDPSSRTSRTSTRQRRNPGAAAYYI